MAVARQSCKRGSKLQRPKPLKMENQQITAMFTVQGMRQFVCDRLTEAAQDILGAFEKRAQEYELELARQRKLLESVYSPSNTLLSDDTQPHIKEEQTDITITDVQPPVDVTILQDGSNPKEVQNATRKGKEASTPNQVTEVSSPLHESSATQKPSMGNGHKTPAKHVHNKCSHGYRLPKGCASKQTKASKNNDMPLPSSNAPAELEVIEIEDNSLSSSDIEILGGVHEPGQNVDKEMPISACGTFEKKAEECTEPLSLNENSKPNEENPSLPLPSALEGKQEGTGFNMEHGTVADSVENASSDIAIASLDLPLECPNPPDYEENMTFCENTTANYKNDTKLHQEEYGELVYELPNQMRFPSSINNECNNEDNSYKPTFTDLDNTEKLWHLSTEQAIIVKDASYNTASSSLTGSSMEQFYKDPASTLINEMNSVFTVPCEINLGSPRTNQEASQTYSYEWKRPTNKKETGQDGGKNPFQCDICGKVLSNFKNYKYHVKYHTTEKRFKCETCGKMFWESWDLNKHLKIHSGEKPFKCSDCGKAFNRRFNLDLHMRVHTGEKPYACESCEKAFTSRVNLRKHERIHTGEKPYNCGHCQKEFADSSSFRNHQRVHTGEKPYKCCFCKKKFATRTTLKRHVRIHTGEKPYKCSVCEKCFATNTDLKVHTRIHTGERPYKCEDCGQEFSSWTNYNRHTNIHKPKTTKPVTQ